MKRPSSRHLSHDYEAYKGLSLRELFWIVLVTTPTISLLCSLGGLYIDYPLACGCVGFLVGFIVSITTCPKRAARLKSGKPHGYLMKKTILILVNLHFRHSPYLHHQGAWRKSKYLRNAHV